MKKIFYIAMFILALIELNAHGACLVEQLRLQKTCTGGAAPIKDLSDEKKNENLNRETLGQMLDIPTMAVPMQSRNGYPMVNPAQNCMFGICLPK